MVSEERVRGQIKNSLDWISIQNTKSGHMFMKPIGGDTYILYPIYVQNL